MKICKTPKYTLKIYMYIICIGSMCLYLHTSGMTYLLVS